MVITSVREFIDFQNTLPINVQNTYNIPSGYLHVFPLRALRNRDFLDFENLEGILDLQTGYYGDHYGQMGYTENQQVLYDQQFNLNVTETQYRHFIFSVAPNPNIQSGSIHFWVSDEVFGNTETKEIPLSHHENMRLHLMESNAPERTFYQIFADSFRMKSFRNYYLHVYNLENRDSHYDLFVEPVE